MRYSLVSRFRGTLLGAALGELTSWQEQLSPPVRCPWGSLAVQGIESLIAQGQVDITDWQRLYQQTILTPEPVSLSGGCVLASVPIMLFSHEYKVKLRHNLHQISQVWPLDPSVDPALGQILQESAWALGYAIAQALRDKLKASTLIPKTLHYLAHAQRFSAESVVAAQLQQVQQLLETDHGLDKAQTKLSQQAQSLGSSASLSLPLALAFYCFLSTAEDIRLSIKRASRVQHSPDLTAALTGALAGAYNSTLGIPLTQRLHFQYPAWGISSAGQLFQLSDHLFSTWSGAYSPASLAPPLAITALAAPGTIQPRLAPPSSSSVDALDRCP